MGIERCALQICCDLIPFNLSKICFQAFGLGRLVPFMFIGITDDPLVYAFRLGAKIMIDVLTDGKMKEI